MRSGARTMMRRALGAAVVVAVAAGAAACGDDVPLGLEEGGVEAFVGDEPEGSAALAPASHALVSSVSGTAAGDFQASISADGETWVDLGSPNGITVQLQTTGERTTVHGRQTVPAGAYSRVRLVLSDVQVTVAAGSEIGGVVLDADATVQVAADEPWTIELQVPPFTVSAEADVEVAFDLNSHAWLTSEAVQTGVASETEVRTAVSASAAATP